MCCCRLSKLDRVVLAVTAVFEQYAELFVSWFPFYYLFKCAFLGLLLTPNTKVRYLDVDEISVASSC